MDTTTIITIVIGIIAAAALYHFLQIIGPIIRMIMSLVVFIIIFFLLQRFFNVDFSPIINPIRQYLRIETINNIISFVGNYISQSISFIENLISQIPQ